MRTQVPVSVLCINGCLAVGTQDDSCQYTLCYGTYKHGGIHATHMYTE